MAVTGESLFSTYKNFTSADSTGTYYSLIDGGTAQGKAVTLAQIINQDTVSNTITVALERYVSTAYETVFEKSYLVSADDKALAVEFIAPLVAAASNPDRIRVKITESVSSGKKVTVIFSGADFS